MQPDYHERSEQWPESERGEDLAERLEAVQKVLEATTELAAADTKNSVKTLDGHLRCLVVLLFAHSTPSLWAKVAGFTISMLFICFSTSKSLSPVMISSH